MHGLRRVPTRAMFIVTVSQLKVPWYKASKGTHITSQLGRNLAIYRSTIIKILFRVYQNIIIEY